MRKLNTADVFNLVRLINVSGIKNSFRSELEKVINGEKVVLDPTQDGMTLVFALMTAMAEQGAEEAFYEFISAPLEKSAEDVKNMNPIELLENIKELANLEEWKSFFKYAGNLAK